MRTHRQRQATTVIVMLAVLLGSLWAGGLAASATDNAADRLATSRSLPSVEAAIPSDRTQGLRPLGQRPDPGGRLLPLLLGLLAASLAVTYGVGARRRRSSLAPAGLPVLSAPRGPRAPPRLQPD